MSREEEVLRLTEDYVNNLKAVKTNPPIQKRYSNKSKDKIAVSMRSYYKQMANVLQSA